MNHETLMARYAFRFAEKHKVTVAQIKGRIMTKGLCAFHAELSEESYLFSPPMQADFFDIPIRIINARIAVHYQKKETQSCVKI